ncbi:MAG: cytochrome C [Nitrospinae bacterium CG11_big_fil_rev_8_21_14_0_20_56_8]|nr:MAG: cytochrome C [Nitrospinae bacterium CG11_big_fil_rev_8_21_14_0_20_56_8]
MKKGLVLAVFVVFSFVATASVFAGECPQPRKTGAAPANIAAMDELGGADAKNGERLFQKDAKPMACMQCHGPKGDGMGKLGAGLKPKPRNFTCAETMKDVSPGQMFFIIKNGSKGTPMIPQKLTDKEIWDVIKYVRTTFAK